jgi:CubicO group peptidase (beta-lactamase class C family)
MVAANYGLTIAPADATDPEELAAWLDPLVEQKMAEGHIPGAVFLLVKDGAVAYARGYGVADMAEQTPVDVEGSLWRVMSLSKPVTAVAAMQLAEQGRLELDTDIETYLRSIDLPEAFGQPITMHQLLTHSAGLDWDLDDIGTEAAEPPDLAGNAQFLAGNPPARIFPPGQHILYSNGAFDIAGQMVEDISGEPFAGYVERAIFQPLGMARSSFRQPPPVADGLVTGYEFDGAAHQPVPLPLYQDPPSRAMTATAPDMARFIRAMLGDGGPILRPESLQALLDTQFTYKDGTPGMAYGWDDMAWPAARVLWKDGAAAGALSRIVLVPEHELGFFLAYNLDDGMGLANAVTEEFLERAFPYEVQLPAPAPGAEERARELAGVYRPLGYSHHTIVKGLRLMWPDFPRVLALDDGRLEVRFSPDPSAAHELVEVEPLHYRTSDGRVQYVFRRNAQGQPAGFAAGAYVAEKVAWYDTSRAHQLMVVAFMAVFFLGAVAGLIASIRRPPASRLGQWSVWLLTLTAALNCAVLAILLVVLGVADLNLAFGMPAWLAAVAAVPLLTSALAVVLAVLGLLNWRLRTLAGRGLVLYGLVTLAALAFVPWLDYWNLLGFR